MKALIAFVLTGITLSTYAQTSDTVSYQLEATTPVSKIGLNLHKQSSYLLPAGGILYGILSQESHLLRRVDVGLNSEFREEHHQLTTRIDDHLQYMPAVSVYALGLMGVEGKNDMIDKTILYFISNSLTGLTVGVLKKETHRLRPDASDFRSFPSGHTAAAFAAAEFMRQEYKDVSPWYGVAAYSMASATGSLRMMKNKHWLSDVVMGAGVGMLATKLTYKVYPLVKKRLGFHQHSNILLVPNYHSGYAGFALSARLN